MRIAMKCELERDGGESEKFTVIADARDVRAYEAEFKVSWIATELSFTQLSQLAFVTARRLAKFKGSYDVWDASATDVSSADAEEEGPVEPAGPTKRGRTAKQSSA